MGAKNLGTPEFIERSELFGSRICARCERKSRRMIGGTRCVSCYNRELEARTGLNKRGNPLKKIHVYFQAVVRFLSRDGTEGTVTFKVESEAEAIRCARMMIPDLLKISGVELVRS
jgi:hypothetical protein